MARDRLPVYENITHLISVAFFENIGITVRQSLTLFLSHLTADFYFHKFADRFHTPYPRQSIYQQEHKALQRLNSKMAVAPYMLTTQKSLGLKLRLSHSQSDST